MCVPTRSGGFHRTRHRGLPLASLTELPPLMSLTPSRRGLCALRGWQPLETTVKAGDCAHFYGTVILSHSMTEHIPRRIPCAAVRSTHCALAYSTHRAPACRIVPPLPPHPSSMPGAPTLPLPERGGVSLPVCRERMLPPRVRASDGIRRRETGWFYVADSRSVRLVHAGIFPLCCKSWASQAQ